MIVLEEDSYAFTETGYLTPGFIDITMKDLKAYFAERIPDQKTRSELFQGLHNLVAMLSELGIQNFQMWIGGSFVSVKQQPKDIDVVCLIDYNELMNVTAQSQRLLLSSDLKERIRYFFHCDMYPVAVFPKESPYRAYTENRLMYWRGVWGFDRKFIPRGVLNITIGKGCETWMM